MQLVTTPHRSRLIAVGAALAVLWGLVGLSPAVAFAAPGSTSIADTGARDCHSGDLNDCRIDRATFDDEAADAQGEPNRDAPTAGVQCATVASAASDDCDEYAQGPAFAENLFAEGSDEDQDFVASFVNGRGGETMCWVGGKSYPCSKILRPVGDAVVIAVPGSGNALAAEETSDGAESEEYEEQRAAYTPIGGCPLAPSQPCYQQPRR